MSIAPDSTRARDDWEEIKADIKQLIKELRSIASQTQPLRQPNPEPEPLKPKVRLILRSDFEDSGANPIQTQYRRLEEGPGILDSPLEGRSKGWLAEFQPTSQKLQSLVDVLLIMFIRNKDGHAILGNTRLSIKVVESFPSFADKLTLRLSEPPKGVKEKVTPNEMSTESAKKLRKHVSSPTLWSVKLHELYEEIPDLDPKVWIWDIPRDGDFRCIYVHGDNDNIE